MGLTTIGVKGPNKELLRYTINPKCSVLLKSGDHCKTTAHGLAWIEIISNTGADGIFLVKLKVLIAAALDNGVSFPS